MKYKNAKKVLPDELMDEVQKYIQGEYLYVPKADGSRKSWGTNTGYRKKLTIRNENIRNAFKEGITIEELMGQYYLSESTIKKIIYMK